MTYTVDASLVELLNYFEGVEPRVVAERCEGDRWELGRGASYWLDGTPVKEGDTCTYDQALELQANALSVESALVWKALSFEPNRYQVAALAFLAYNVGGTAAAKSSVVRLMNEGNFYDAAAAFGMWTGATSEGPSEREVERGLIPSDAPSYRMEGGRWVWIGPDGKPCEYFRRMRGLLRRHHAEGLLSLGLHYEPACDNDAVFLRSKRRWNDKKGRWQDYVVSQTSFKEVYDVAKDYPLSPDSVKKEEPVKAAEVVMPKPKEPLKIKEIEIAKKKPIDSVEIPPEEVGISPNAPLKKMRKSKRYKGMKQAENFKKIAEITKTVGATAGTFGAGSVPVLQQMTKPATLFAAALLSGAIICVVLYFIAKKKSEQGIEIYEEGLREASQGLT